MLLSVLDPEVELLPAELLVVGPCVAVAEAEVELCPDDAEGEEDRASGIEVVLVDVAADDELLGMLELVRMVVVELDVGDSNEDRDETATDEALDETAFEPTLAVVVVAAEEIPLVVESCV